MQLVVEADPGAVAGRAAAFVAAEARAAVHDRGRFVMAVSGGRTPGLMLRALAAESVPWHAVRIVQVDERVAPSGDPDRNLMELRAALLGRTPLRPEQIHAMPVEARDLVSAAAAYAGTLRDLAGLPPIIDFVHLGLGLDGHTASLIPGDPALEVLDADVALTEAYQGRRRMTLTYSIINRTRRIMWLVTGGEKAEMLKRLFARDPAIPAGRVGQDRAFVVADQAAAQTLAP